MSENTVDPVEQVRQDLRDIRIFSGRYFPFVVIPLSYMRIVASESVPTAGVDEAGTLAVNPEWWIKLDAEAKRYVAIHEALHVCLTGDTKVLTARGLLDIKDVKVGDYVYSRDGSFTRVTAVSKRPYDGEVVEIVPTFGLKATLTPEHLVLTVPIHYSEGKGFRKCLLKKVRSRLPSVYRPAETLKKYDALVFPIPRVQGKETKPRGFQLRRCYEKYKVRVDGDLAYFLGWFVADGHLSRRRVTTWNTGHNLPAGKRVMDKKESERLIVISAGLYDKIDKLLQVIREKLHRTPVVFTDEEQNVVRISFSSKSLAKWLRRNFYYQGEKAIPRWLISAKHEVIEGFIKGLVEGDGHVCEKAGRVSLASTSRLVYSFVPLLLLRLGKNPSLKFEKVTGYGSGEVAVIKWQDKITHRHAVRVGNRWCVPIKLVRKRRHSGFVYNLETKAGSFATPFFVVHNCLCHPFRRKGFDPETYNVAADGKINDSIDEANISGVSCNGKITLESISRQTGINVEVLRKMSTEEIARELEEKAVSITLGEGELGEDLLDGRVEGEVVQEGDKSVAGKKNAKELEREWKYILERARDFAKQAGNMPVGLERVVKEVLEVKPPWHLVVRFGIRNHSKQDSSFAYPSRRGDDYPGYYGYRYSVWCLVDCSGSIDEGQLKHFLGIVKHEARKGDIYAIPWDGAAYQVLKAARPADVARKIAPMMRGGGGTTITPVLRKVLSLMKPGDAVIVLTDGDIYDAEQDETQMLFRKVSAKAGFAMLGYTRTPVDAAGFAMSRIDFQLQG